MRLGVEPDSEREGLRLSAMPRNACMITDVITTTKRRSCLDRWMKFARSESALNLDIIFEKANVTAPMHLLAIYIRRASVLSQLPHNLLVAPSPGKRGSG